MVEGKISAAVNIVKKKHSNNNGSTSAFTGGIGDVSRCLISVLIADILLYCIHYKFPWPKPVQHNLDRPDFVPLS